MSWFDSLPKSARVDLHRLVEPKWTPFIPHQPTVPQTAFLLLPHQEAFYGGAAGGGKSDALLMGALQYADVPGYAALLLRRTYADLSLPGALMDRAHQWLAGTAAQWRDKDKTWRFPSGASLTFGYLETENDKYRYQGSEFQYIGFDELTQFTQTMYLYLMSRLRRLSELDVPLRQRGAANPGGLGHEWVKHRFIETGIKSGRPFVPAKLDDNPYLDKAEYEKSLAQLDPITRARLRNGNWDVRESGGYFDRTWFAVVDRAPTGLRWVRAWDFASTEPSDSNPDPDWTVGVKMAEQGGRYFVGDVVRRRLGPGAVDELVAHTAELDGKSVKVRVPQDPGAAGKSFVEHLKTRVLKGYSVFSRPVSGDKVERAKPFSAAAFNRLVSLVRGDWNFPYLETLQAFPSSAHDDDVDASSDAFSELRKPAVAWA